MRKIWPQEAFRWLVKYAQVSLSIFYGLSIMLELLPSIAGLQKCYVCSSVKKMYEKYKECKKSVSTCFGFENLIPHTSTFSGRGVEKT